MASMVEIRFSDDLNDHVVEYLPESVATQPQPKYEYEQPEEDPLPETDPLALTGQEWAHEYPTLNEESVLSEVLLIERLPKTVRKRVKKPSMRCPICSKNTINFPLHYSQNHAQYAKCPISDDCPEREFGGFYRWNAHKETCPFLPPRPPPLVEGIPSVDLTRIQNELNRQLKPGIASTSYPSGEIRCQYCQLEFTNGVQLNSHKCSSNPQYKKSNMKKLTLKASKNPPKKQKVPQKNSNFTIVIKSKDKEKISLSRFGNPPSNSPVKLLSVDMPGPSRRADEEYQVDTDEDEPETGRKQPNSLRPVAQKKTKETKILENDVNFSFVVSDEWRGMAGPMVQCPYCTNLPMKFHTLIRHIGLFHSDMDKDHLRCLLCLRNFESLGAMMFHFNKHKTTWIDCFICSKKINVMYMILHLMLQHAKEKSFEQFDNFTCWICKELLFCPSIDQVRLHIRDHLVMFHKLIFPEENTEFNVSKPQNASLLSRDGKPNECKICSRKFVLNVAFQAHMKKHEGDELTLLKAPVVPKPGRPKLEPDYQGPKDEIFGKCPFGDTVEIKFENLLSHLQTMHEMALRGENRCAWCMMTYHSPQLHELTHSSMTTCVICGVAYPFSKMAHHLIVEHARVRGDKTRNISFHCWICWRNLNFDDFNGVRTHIVQHAVRYFGLSLRFITLGTKPDGLSFFQGKNKPLRPVSLHTEVKKKIIPAKDILEYQISTDEEEESETGQNKEVDDAGQPWKTIPWSVSRKQPDVIDIDKDDGNDKKIDESWETIPWSSAKPKKAQFSKNSAGSFKKRKSLAEDGDSDDCSSPVPKDSLRSSKSSLEGKLNSNSSHRVDSCTSHEKSCKSARIQSNVSSFKTQLSGEKLPTAVVERCNMVSKKNKSNTNLKSNQYKKKISESEEDKAEKSDSSADDVTNESQKFKCPDCWKSFKTKTNLSVHAKVHSQKDLYKCQKCPRKFAWKDNFKAHQALHDEEAFFECDFCGHHYAMKNSLRLHINGHLIKKEMFVCDVCKKSYNRERDLLLHAVVHFKQKYYECEFCAKEFFRKSSLVRHERKHQGNLLCRGCCKVFDRFSALKNHQRDCSSKFKCEFCKESFLMRLLEKHKMMCGEKEVTKKMDKLKMRPVVVIERMPNWFPDSALKRQSKCRENSSRSASPGKASVSWQ